MSTMRTALAIGVTLGALAGAGEASAAKAVARLITEPGSSTANHPGEAIATITGSNAAAAAFAYEYGGALGVGAYANGTGGGSRPGFAEAGADAALNDTFTVALGDPGLFEDVDGFYTLAFVIEASGSVASTNAPYAGNPGTYSLGGATYRYSYSVGGRFETLTGGGYATSSKDFYHNEVEDGAGAKNHILKLIVVEGDVIPISLFAHAGASGYGLPGAPATAAADFTHTLKWGGVIGITATDAFGNPLALPDGFKLSLKGASGFDYWNAAGRNPFLPAPGGGIPEPSTWAMMLLGFFGMGSLIRNQRRRLAPV